MGEWLGPVFEANALGEPAPPCSTHCTAIECMLFRNRKALGVGGCRAGRCCGCCRPLRTA